LIASQSRCDSGLTLLLTQEAFLTAGGGPIGDISCIELLMGSELPVIDSVTHWAACRGFGHRPQQIKTVAADRQL
jgi:hypothetical protein